MFVTDEAGSNSQFVDEVTPSGSLTHFAGLGPRGYRDGPATAAEFNYPYGIVLDQAGNIILADEGNNVIRKISTSGTVSTLAGGGTAVNGSALSVSIPNVASDRENIQRNGWRHVETHDVGLSDAPDVLTCQGAAGGGNWSLASRGDHSFAVRLVRLDDHLYGHTHERPHVGRDLPVVAYDEHRLVLAGKRGHDLRDPRVHGAGELLEALQQRHLLRVVQHRQRVAQSVECVSGYGIGHRRDRRLSLT